MSRRFEGADQLNEIIFQDNIDSFPIRDNFRKLEDVMAAHATEIEALLAGDPASGAEVVAARDDEATLGDSITKPAEIPGDGMISGVGSEWGVIATGGANVDVPDGSGLIDGRRVLTSGTQNITPDNFSLGITDPRIDVVYIGSSGTVGVVTGTPAAIPEPEQAPDNTVILSWLYLRPSGGNPNVPLEIFDTNNGTDSFIMRNLQRGFVQRDDTDPHRHPGNILRNGAFLEVDVSNVLTHWTMTNTSLQRSAVQKIFGNYSGLVNGQGGAGAAYIEQEITDLTYLRGRWVTFSAYLMLETENAKTARLTTRMVGDSPEQDTEATSGINNKMWQRIHQTLYIDNSITSLFFRIEGDTTDANSTGFYVTGAQLSIGKILTEFEYPMRLPYTAEGAIEFQTTELSSLVVTGNTRLEGSLYVLGHEDSESAVLAWVALGL